MISTGMFLNVPLSLLQVWANNYAKLVGETIPNAHQSYDIAGRHFNRANVADAAPLMDAIYTAIAMKSGQVTRVTYSDMSGWPG